MKNRNNTIRETIDEHNSSAEHREKDVKLDELLFEGTQLMSCFSEY
jgi:hypothetical protein